MPDIRAPAIRPALQFADLAQERDVATIGIWVFLVTSKPEVAAELNRPSA